MILSVITLFLFSSFGRINAQGNETLCNIASRVNWLNWNCGTPYCSWEGVQCNGDSDVNEIKLTDKSLTGSIPTEMGKLSSLERLYLNGNLLTGTIPSELGLLTKLKQLFINQNPLIPSLSNDLLSLLCNLDEFVSDFIQDNDRIRYCSGIIHAIPLSINGNFTYDSWDISHLNLMLKSNTHLTIGNNLLLSENSTLTLEIISNTPYINVGSCLHINNGTLILKDSESEIDYDREYELISYRCHVGTFKSVRIEHSNSKCVGDINYNPDGFTFSFKECPKNRIPLIVGVSVLGFAVLVVIIILIIMFAVPSIRYKVCPCCRTDMDGYTDEMEGEVIVESPIFQTNDKFSSIYQPPKITSDNNNQSSDLQV